MKWMRKVLPALILCLAACAGNNATSRVIKPDVNKVNDLAFLRQAGVNVDSIAAAEKAASATAKQTISLLIRAFKSIMRI